MAHLGEGTYTVPMAEDELRSELAAWLRQKHLASFESMRRRQEEQNALSDEDWWQQELSRAADFPSPLQDMMPAVKEELLKQRREMANAYSPERFDQMIAKMTDDVMPWLIEVWRDAGEDGALTNDQYCTAFLRQSRASIESSLTRLQAMTEG
jgi:hypothetical protein